MSISVHGDWEIARVVMDKFQAVFRLRGVRFREQRRLSEENFACCDKNDDSDNSSVLQN